MKSKLTIAKTLIFLFFLAAFPLRAQESTFSFGVISQRNALITASYWNPILRYVSQRSGVPLQLKLAKNGLAHASMIHRGEFDFIYSNHNLSIENDAVGYSVFARPAGEPIRGEIIVLKNSPIKSLNELQGKTVAFPSMVAFVGYHVPIDALVRAKIHIQPEFAGNQESALWQLFSGKTAAAAINSEMAKDFAERNNFSYRVLWSSEEFLNIPLSAHPNVPKQKVAAVRDAFLHMAEDPEGMKILTTSAQLIKQIPPFGFVVANDREFDNIRKFYKNSIVKVELP